MRRLLCLLVWLSPAGLAQLQNLATTTDGSVLYFDTDYQLKGDRPWLWSKIVRWSSRGFEMFREVERVMVTPRKSNYFRLARLSVSGDGAVIGYNTSAYCLEDRTGVCVGFEDEAGVVEVAGRPIAGAGPFPVVSPDGRYVFYRASSLMRLDLRTGTSMAIPGLYLPGPRFLAAGGTALLADAGGNLIVWTDSSRTALRIERSIYESTISADGRTVAYESIGEVHARDVASGRDVTLASAPLTGIDRSRAALHPRVSDDGSLVAWRMPAAAGAPFQVWVQGSEGVNQRRLTDEPDGIREFTMSGNGSVLYAVTGNSRLLRIERATATVREISPAVPPAGLLGPYAPGALLTYPVVPGVGRPDVSAGGRPALLLWSDRAHYTFQLPWEAPVGGEVTVTYPESASPLIEVMNREPHILGRDVDLYLNPCLQSCGVIVLAVHQDFGSLVTKEAPAAAGEIVHLYANGLGAVSPPIKAGAVTPIDRLHPLATPLVCSVESGGTKIPAPVRFAGLAPGYIGIHQIDLEVPRGITAGNAALSCEDDAPSGLGPGTWYMPVRP